MSKCREVVTQLPRPVKPYKYLLFLSASLAQGKTYFFLTEKESTMKTGLLSNKDPLLSIIFSITTAGIDHVYTYSSDKNHIIGITFISSSSSSSIYGYNYEAASVGSIHGVSSWLVAGVCGTNRYNPPTPAIPTVTQLRSRIIVIPYNCNCSRSKSPPVVCGKLST